jgi:hypothetical protein
MKLRDEGAEGSMAAALGESPALGSKRTWPKRGRCATKLVAGGSNGAFCALRSLAGTALTLLPSSLTCTGELHDC